MLTSLLQGTAVHILTIFYRNVTVGVDVFDILNLITLSPVVLRPWGHLLSHEYSIVVSFFLQIHGQSLIFAFIFQAQHSPRFIAA